MHMFNVYLLYRKSIKLFHKKTVVGVDRPMKALSMHIQKPYKGKIVLLFKAVILSKTIFF